MTEVDAICVSDEHGMYGGVTMRASARCEGPSENDGWQKEKEFSESSRGCFVAGQRVGSDTIDVLPMNFSPNHPARVHRKC